MIISIKITEATRVPYNGPHDWPPGAVDLLPDASLSFNYEGTEAAVLTIEKAIRKAIAKL